MDEDSKLALKVGGIFTTVAGIVAVTVISAVGGLGSRGIKDEYTFQYNRRPAIVQHEGRILSRDNYWILINGKDRITNGTLISDEGKEISVINSDNPLCSPSWSIRDSYSKE